MDFQKVKKFVKRNSYTFEAIAVIIALVITVMLLTTSCVSATNDKGAIVKNVSDDVMMVEPIVIEKEVIVEKEPIYFEGAEFFELTKSQLLDRLDKINALIASAEALSMGDTSLVTQARIEVECINKALENGSYLYPYSDNDLNVIAYMMFDEAGDNLFTDEEQMLVGCVILNRRNMGGINGKMTNPSILDVINERGQYAIAVKTGYKFNGSNGKVSLDKIPERCYNNARKVLEHKYTCPENVVYQSLGKQGSGVYKSFYHGAPYYNTTYFCYL